MDIQLAFSVYDIVSQRYSSPYFCINREEYLRSFGDMIAQGNSPYNLHPDDYILHEVGAFDLSQGFMKAYEARVRIGSVKDLFASTLEKVAKKQASVSSPPVTA